MTTQSEATLEKNLITQLKKLDYIHAKIHNEETILENLKTQLESFNKTTFSKKEFNTILNHLSKGNVLQKAKTLRDRYHLTKDNEESFYVRFFDSENWNNNLYQVTSQVSIEGDYKNRYDVTLLVNGLPLVQIELKRRGIELKEAFNQINRYQRQSFWANTGLFQYVQIFIISNGVNTKYYANNKKQEFKQTFFWAHENNQNITNLTKFTESFLNKDHLGKMISHYVVINDTSKILMILRPYQYYATEAIINHVKNKDDNGYIWHTTGSGKTLTSFKASQIITDMPEVHKVVFVVDRKDLDYQTINEFNNFKDGSIDGTDNTKILVDQFIGVYQNKKGEAKNSKLIITTIQKLNNAIHNDRYKTIMGDLKDKPIVFIFDECHRSQFGETHKRITKFFNNCQMFGFTGTPIFKKNVIKNDLGKRTTWDLFGDCLHKYIITDAIRDENVLRFSVEYLGKYKNKYTAFKDTKVEKIDTTEVIESYDRHEKIAEYIIDHHNQKTHNRDFSAIFAVSSIDSLKQYYKIFKEKIKELNNDLRIATIFTFETNEDDKDANGMLPEDIDVVADSTAGYMTKHSREILDEIMNDYNALYGTGFSTKDSRQFDNYYKDISKRLKDRERVSFKEKDRLDILLVVNMFLTGFDAKKVNTLYVDKNLKYHGLIQAFSRTNRILGEKKSHGNILCFRNLKDATDEAITLFSNKDAKEVIIIPPYEEYVREFSKAFAAMLVIAPTVKSVDDLISEDDQFKFIQAFRELMRIRNVLKTYSEFTWDDLVMKEQIFEDYKSKYLDLYEKVKNDRKKDKTSILEDIDFELELIHRDEINVAYILRLLAKFKGEDEATAPGQRKAILDLLAGDVELRSKRELIEKFINDHLPAIDVDDIEDEFEKYWQDQKVEAINKICEEENLDHKQFQALMESYIYSEQVPVRDDVLKCLDNRPSVLQARAIGERIIDKMKEFVDVFVRGVAV
jgi:type I restriction enzyme, R subunit